MFIYRYNNSYWPFVTSWTIACQVPLCIGFSRQEYWSGLPFLFPGDLPNLWKIWATSASLKNPPAKKKKKKSACNAETWVWSLGWEDPLEKGTATHSSILAWRIPWTEEPGRLQSMNTTEQLSRHYNDSCIDNKEITVWLLHSSLPCTLMNEFLQNFYGVQY